jgi:hypothetical protein
VSRRELKLDSVVIKDDDWWGNNLPVKQHKTWIMLVQLFTTARTGNLPKDGALLARRETITTFKVNVNRLGALDTKCL